MRISQQQQKLSKIYLAKTNILNLDAKHIQKESTFIHLRFFFLLSNKLTFSLINIKLTSYLFNKMTLVF